MAAGDGDSSSMSSFGHLRPGVSHKGVEGSRFGFSAAGAARLLYQAVINIDLKGDDRWHEVQLVLLATMCETRRGSHRFHAAAAMGGGDEDAQDGAHGHVSDSTARRSGREPTDDE